MRGEPLVGGLAKPERRGVVKTRENRQQRLTRAQVRQIVYTRAKGRCERCGRKVTFDAYPLDPEHAEVNERVPRSRGGSPYEPDNGELTCAQCHRPRGEHAPTKARMDRLNALAAKASARKALARG